MGNQADNVLAMRVCDVYIGVRLSDIKEIMQMPMSGLMCAPTFPKSALGIVNVRGRIASVINTWLCLGETEPKDISEAIICLFEINGEIVGFAADELLSTVTGFDAYEQAQDDDDKIRLCDMEFRMVNNVGIGLVKPKDLYACARQLANKGL